MAEAHQRQMDAIQEAHNQQYASVLQYLQTLGHVVAPQAQLPPLPQVYLPPVPRPATISPVSYFRTLLFLFLVVT